MKKFYDLYNDYFDLNLSNERIDYDLSELFIKRDDIKQLLNGLNLHINVMIDNYFNELKKLNIKIPFKFKNKSFIIKNIPHFNYKMIDIKANMTAKLLLDIKEYIMINNNHNSIKNNNKEEKINNNKEEKINNNKEKKINNSIVEPIIKKTKEKNKKHIAIENKKDITKYVSEIKNPLFYFDKVKLEIVQQQLNEQFELAMLNYIDELKKEFVYLFKYSLNPNDDEQILKMLMSLDRLVEKKLDNYGKQYVKKAS